MIRTILFDMGGTLDGDGLHWLERFLDLYQSFGLELPLETIRAAFDDAEERCSTDGTIASASFAQMVRLHVNWQLAHLGVNDPTLCDHLVEGFIESVHEATRNSAQLLAGLAEQGFELGVVSNGCGNVERLCADFGFRPFLSVIVDSRHVGLFKPDPAIFLYAAHKLRGEPANMMMVGDSFERDILPAKRIGMQTAWLEGAAPRECPNLSLVDLRLRSLSDLRSTVFPFRTKERRFEIVF